MKRVVYLLSFPCERIPFLLQEWKWVVYNIIQFLTFFTRILHLLLTSNCQSFRKQLWFSSRHERGNHSADTKRTTSISEPESIHMTRDVTLLSFFLCCLWFSFLSDGIDFILLLLLFILLCRLFSLVFDTEHSSYKNYDMSFSLVLLVRRSFKFLSLSPFVQSTSSSPLIKHDSNSMRERSEQSLTTEEGKDFLPFFSLFFFDSSISIWRKVLTLFSRIFLPHKTGHNERKVRDRNRLLTCSSMN